MWYLIYDKRRINLSNWTKLLQMCKIRRTKLQQMCNKQDINKQWYVINDKRRINLKCVKLEEKKMCNKLEWCASRGPANGYDESMISQFFFAQCLWKLHICSVEGLNICMFMFVFVQKRQQGSLLHSTQFSGTSKNIS